MYNFVEMNECVEDGEQIDIQLAERIQLGQFNPSYLDDIRNSRYAQFLNWASE